MNWLPIAEFPHGTKEALAFQFLLCHREKKWIRFGRFFPQQREWYYSATNERTQYAQTRGDEPTHFARMPDLPK